MTNPLNTFGYDPKLHDALRWSVVKNGKRWDRGFKSEADAWRAVGRGSMSIFLTDAQLIERRKEQGYSVVPIAWAYKKVVDSSLPV